MQTAGFHITSVVQGGTGEFTPSGPVSGNTEDEMKVSHAGGGDWARRLVETGQVQSRLSWPRLGTVDREMTLFLVEINVPEVSDVWKRCLDL